MPTIRDLSKRSRRARPTLDRTARRYFVYWLFDADKACLYIGRSCNVRERMRVHSTEKAWFTQVRGIEMDGPFTWDEAVRVEGAAARAAQPPGNTIYTERWPKKATRAQG